MKPRLIIVADDLTGAADSAVPFAARGYRTSVVLDPTWSCDAEVLAIDTESRALPPARAMQQAAAVIEGSALAAPLFKKIDSTLRGYIGPECAASLRAYRRAVPGGSLLVAPAFPAMGRTTKDGIQLLNGRPIGSITQLLDRAGLRVALVKVGGPFPRGVDAWVCDAVCQEDLSWHLQQVVDSRPLLVGSGGLARAVAASFTIQVSEIPRPRIQGSVLFVVGSASSTSREQVDSLAPDVIRATPENTSILTGQQDAVLYIAPAEGRELSPAVSRNLASCVAPHLHRFGAIFVTGGATARAVLDTMKVKELRLLGELEPGVPISATDAGQILITKAGAFGDVETLERCRLRLRT